MGYGNNAAPVAEGKCCDNCNFTQVISARLVKEVVVEEEEGSECMGCAKTYTVDTDIGDQFCNDCGDDWFCLECLDYGDGWDLEHTEFLCFRCDNNRHNEEDEDEEEEVQEG